MFGSAVLETAIGLVFIFLLLSLACTAAKEGIELWWKRRSIDLERGIRELLDDPASAGRLVERVYNHPLVRGLVVGAYDPATVKGPAGAERYTGGNLPSYIPARTFALALMDVIRPGDAADQAQPSGARGAAPAAGQPAPADAFDALRDAVQRSESEQAKRALLTLIDAAGGSVAQARANIEGWFNAAMDRVSGRYKRWTQQIIFLLGLTLTLALNVDAIAIARRLWLDEPLRQAVVATAETHVKETGGKAPGPSPTEDDAKKRYKKAKETLDGLGLPIGWSEYTRPAYDVDGIGAWVMKAFGWLLTALAISLGAPFWFDVLNKVMVIRSTVKPREKSHEEGSEDRTNK